MSNIRSKDVLGMTGCFVIVGFINNYFYAFSDSHIREK